MSLECLEHVIHEKSNGLFMPCQEIVCKEHNPRVTHPLANHAHTVTVSKHSSHQNPLAVNDGENMRGHKHRKDVWHSAHVNTEQTETSTYKVGKDNAEKHKTDIGNIPADYGKDVTVDKEESKSKKLDKPVNSIDKQQPNGGKRSQYDKYKAALKKSIEEKWREWQLNYEQHVDKFIKERTWKENSDQQNLKNSPDSCQTGSSKHSYADADGNAKKDTCSSTKVPERPATANNTSIFKEVVSKNNPKARSEVKTNPPKKRPQSACVVKHQKVQNVQELLAEYHRKKDAHKQEVEIQKRKQESNKKEVQKQEIVNQTKLAEKESVAIKEMLNKEILKQNNESKKTMPQFKNPDNKSKTSKQEHDKMGQHNEPHDMPEAELSEAELMRGIIDQFVRANYTEGEWLHWLHDEADPTHQVMMCRLLAVSRCHYMMCRLLAVSRCNIC